MQRGSINGLRVVLSQISIWGATSENRGSEIQWRTAPKTLKKANLRQNPFLHDRHFDMQQVDKARISGVWTAHKDAYPQ
jgi:hypothetical protein